MKAKNKEKCIETVASIIGERSDITAEEVVALSESKFTRLRTAEFREVNKFDSAEELAEWWIGQFIAQDGRCCYCKTRIADIQKLIKAGLLKTRRVGRDGSGERGPQFEIERMDSTTNFYSRENCKLSCYYCNNDKSYIFPADDFEQFMGKAKGEYFSHLLKKLSGN